MAIYHFSRTRVSETRVPHQFCHRGTAKVEIEQLKKNMWHSSMVNSEYHAIQYSSISSSSTIL